MESRSSKLATSPGTTGSLLFSFQQTVAGLDADAKYHNATIISGANRIFKSAEGCFDRKEYARAVVAYEEAITLLKLIPHDERDIEYYTELDQYACNLADAYLKLKDYPMTVARYLTAFNALEFIEKKSGLTQENQWWLADYALAIGGSLKRLGDKASEDYLDLAVAILNRMKFAFGLRRKDKEKLVECYVLQKNHSAAMSVLDSIKTKDDIYHRLAARCSEILAIDVDPIEEPVTEATTDSVLFSLKAIMERYQVKNKTSEDTRLIDKCAVDLQNTLTDIKKFIIQTNKRKLDEMEGEKDSQEQSVSTSTFSTFKKPRLISSQEVEDTYTLEPRL